MVYFRRRMTPCARPSRLTDSTEPRVTRISPRRNDTHVWTMSVVRADLVSNPGSFRLDAAAAIARVDGQYGPPARVGPRRAVTRSITGQISTMRFEAPTMPHTHDGHASAVSSRFTHSSAFFLSRNAPYRHLALPCEEFLSAL